MKVLLDSIEKVKKFVSVIERLDGDYDLVSGRYVVDAKSIMGVLSLDLTKPLELEPRENAENDILSGALKEFIVD
ncbi:MAG: HPr family phosphocarrier protein [Clostridiales bacterium]|jgi:phosphotransferase system HPr-like phosphotransfer protein|nr:HPr family phosphocarrier protein [Clostridiales bacterium]